jgi:hypothetical protein
LYRRDHGLMKRLGELGRSQVVGTAREIRNER